MKVTMTDLKNEAISSVCFEIDDISKVQIKALMKYVIEGIEKFVGEDLDREIKDPGEPRG